MTEPCGGVRRSHSEKSNTATWAYLRALLLCNSQETQKTLELVLTHSLQGFFLTQNHVPRIMRTCVRGNDMEDNKRYFKGIWIEAEIWLDKDLAPLDKIIYAEIVSLDGPKGCIASNKYLAEFCQCSERKIQDAVRLLKQKGYIVQTAFNGRTRTLRHAKNVMQTRKKCEADSQFLPHINKGDTIADKKKVIKKKPTKKALIGGIEIERRAYSEEQLNALFSPLEIEDD